MFAKFMNKKFFHPGAYPNEKKKWMREQKVAANEKVEKETQAMYQKEQESYQSRMLSAKSEEEKMKLDLNFLYDLPPGMKNTHDDDDFDVKEGDKKEKEVRFEWQKHAPRSKYIQDLGLECQDQPFGVCVRNIRCFTCKEWGHQNTDRECPLFFSNISAEVNAEESTSEDKGSLRLSDPLHLVNVMKEQHGLTLKKSVIGKEIDPMAEMAENQKMLVSDDDDDEELGDADLKFVESLSNRQKRRLLRRLNKLEKKEKRETRRRKRDEGKKKGMHTDKGNKSSYSSSEDDVTEHDHKIYKKQERTTKDNRENKAYKKHQQPTYKDDRNRDYSDRNTNKSNESKNHICTTVEDEINTCDSYTHRKRRNSSRTGNVSIETDYHKRKKSRNRQNERN